MCASVSVYVSISPLITLVYAAPYQNNKRKKLNNVNNNKSVRTVVINIGLIFYGRFFGFSMHKFIKCWTMLRNWASTCNVSGLFFRWARFHIPFIPFLFMPNFQDQMQPSVPIYNRMRSKRTPKYLRTHMKNLCPIWNRCRIEINTIAFWIASKRYGKFMELTRKNRRNWRNSC